MGFLYDLMDADLLKQMVEQRMINITKHPECDYHILNYSHTAQFSRTWNEVTKQCRGLIVDGDPLADEEVLVVARSFPKFFNLSEHDSDAIEDLPLESGFVVTTKLDGSLGILYEMPDGSSAVATRGSFTSDQALWATEFYRKSGYPVAPKDTTLLFEIIFPQNRIVVDYGDMKSLVYLAAIDNDTGADLQLSWEGPRAERFSSNNLTELKAICEASPEKYANQEGFVIRFLPRYHHEPSVRAKAKFSEYVRLHRLITGVSTKTVWEYLSASKPLDELLDHVPDEFYDFIKSTAVGLSQQYERIESEAKSQFAERPMEAERKDLAMLWGSSPHRAVLFKMLDDQPYDSIIWKSLRPNAEKPFREDADA